MSRRAIVSAAAPFSNSINFLHLEEEHNSIRDVPKCLMPRIYVAIWRDASKRSRNRKKLPARMKGKTKGWSKWASEQRRLEARGWLGQSDDGKKWTGNLMVNFKTRTVLKRANEVCSIAQSPSRRRSLQLRTGMSRESDWKARENRGSSFTIPRRFFLPSKMEFLTNGAMRMWVCRSSCRARWIGVERTSSVHISDRSRKFDSPSTDRKFARRSSSVFEGGQMNEARLKTRDRHVALKEF